MKCIWCGHSEHAFEPGKPYCEDCALKCQRECVACKKPYPNLKAFALNEKRCNSCQKKYECNKKKKEMKKLEDDIENDEIKEPEEVAKDMGMENSEDDGGEEEEDDDDGEDEEDNDEEDDDNSISDYRDSKAKSYRKKKSITKVVNGKKREEEIDEQASVKGKKASKKKNTPKTIMEMFEEQQKKNKKMFGVGRKRKITDSSQGYEAKKVLLEAIIDYNQKFPHKGQVIIYL